MSEKNTDYYMQKAYELVFKHEYHTETNSELFDSLIPDGWDIINDTLIIIENKRLIKHKEEGKTHLFNYYDNLSDDIKSIYVTYLILGLGNNKKSFNYVIYDSNKKETNLLIQYKDSVETDDEAIESRESEKDSKSYLLPNAVKNQYIKVSPL